MSKGFNDPGWSDFNSSAPTEYQPGFEQPARQGFGCCFYGCVTAFVLFVLAGVGCYFLFRYVSQEFQRLKATYTDNAPRPLPVVDMPKEKRDEVVKRVQDFTSLLKTAPDAAGARAPTDDERTLVLTADELNAYFESNKGVREKFYVTIEDGKIRAQVSLPLDEIPGFKGRYLNGEGDVLLSVVDGEPVVKLRDLKVKGMPLPEAIRTGLEKTNFAARGDEPGDEDRPPIFARKLEKIEVKDGKLIVVAKKDEADGKPAAPDAADVLTWGTDDGGNGHAYELVKTKKTWTDASALARSRKHNGMTGHLVTITSDAENAFLRDRIAVNERAWIGLTDDPESGGKESRGLADPRREGWAWVTGEKVEFVAWSEGEPSHGGEPPENYAEFNGLYGPRRGQWSDLANDADGGRYYIVEYEPAAEKGAAKE